MAEGRWHKGNLVAVLRNAPLEVIQFLSHRGRVYKPRDGQIAPVKNPFHIFYMDEGISAFIGSATLRVREVVLKCGIPARVIIAGKCGYEKRLAFGKRND